MNDKVILIAVIVGVILSSIILGIATVNFMILNSIQDSDPTQNVITDPTGTTPLSSAPRPLIVWGIGGISLGKVGEGTITSCAPPKTAEVIATISRGSAGNSIKGDAICTSPASPPSVVATATATDIGTGALTVATGSGTEIPGSADCIWTYTPAPGAVAASWWTVACWF